MRAICVSKKQEVFVVFLLTSGKKNVLYWSNGGNVASATKKEDKKMKFIPCKYRYQAIKQMPECCVIKKVCGGYAGFETVTDFEIWKNQK